MGVIHTLADHANRRLLGLDKCRYGKPEYVDSGPGAHWAPRHAGDEDRGLRWGDRETFHSPARFEAGSLAPLSAGAEERAWLDRVVEKVRGFCEAAAWDVTLLYDCSDDDDFYLKAIGYAHAGDVMSCGMGGRYVDDRDGRGNLAMRRVEDPVARALFHDHAEAPDVPVCPGCGWFLCSIAEDAAEGHGHDHCARNLAELRANAGYKAWGERWAATMMMAENAARSR